MRPFKRLHNGIKGPVFDSFLNQDTYPKRVMVWKPGTQSTRQQKRNLRNKARAIIDSVDVEVVAVGDMVIRSVCHEPDPEFSALHLFCAALDASSDTGESWSVCMRYIMSKFDDAAKEQHADTVQQDATARGSRLGRLLRSLVPRPLRARTEALAAADVDQSARNGVAE